MHRIFKKIKRKASLKRRYENPLIEPDEIFLDSSNLPDFDTQQFEGHIERPITRRSLFGIGVAFMIIVVFFSSRLWVLQVAHSATYKQLAENNSLSSEPIFASRGNINDRNGVSLAWNIMANDADPWGLRAYTTMQGFSHVLGYVGYPARDKSGNFWQTKIIGKDGVEKQYDSILNGINGSTIVERDISGKVQGGAAVDQPVNGKDLTLSIDSRVQEKFSQILADEVRSVGFRSASGVMIDVQTGEIIALTNVPEYDSNVMSLGDDTAKIHSYLTDKRTPLLDRAVSGLFTPGSIVKPYIGLEALNEGVIDPLTKIESRGSISIPNPYFPDKPSIFRDYNPDNGWVDMRHAIEVSSNIYFMEIGGGYKSQKGIGIDNIGKAWLRFGMTKETGVDLPAENTGTIPSPAWKAKTFPGEPWRLGDTYNTAIGQYGVQVTPIQMARAIAAIASRGTLVTPHILKDEPPVTEQITDIPDSSYTVIQEGMRLGAIHGLTPGITPVPFSFATKSGTAQVGPGGIDVNSWMTGFFPYEHPRYAFALMFEMGPANGIGTSHRAANDFLGWLGTTLPEYGQNP